MVEKWRKHFVPQQNPHSGCIPWGFEILFRIEGVPKVDFNSFQERFDFDIDPNTPRRNNFNTVSNEIMNVYPYVTITVEDFPINRGNEKIELVESLIFRGKPALISIPLKPFNYPGWHIMPVVEIIDEQFYMLHSISSLGVPQILDLSKTKLVETHSSYRGGHDIAYIESIDK